MRTDLSGVARQGVETSSDQSEIVPKGIYQENIGYILVLTSYE